MISMYRRLNLKWKENSWYHLTPFSDIHRNSPDHDSKRYEKFIKRCTEHEDTLVVGLGEYEDLMSTSERKHWRQKDWHDGTVFWFERNVMKQIEEHADLLMPLAKTGRLLGLSEGDHYYTFQHHEMGLWQGKTTTEYLCHKLDVPYLGCMFLLTVAIPNARKGTNDLQFKVWGHHGKTGGGKDKGMNTLRNLAGFYDSDIFLMGHNHRKAVDRDTIGGYQSRPVGKRDKQILKWHPRLRVLARTGTFLRGLNESPYPSYTELAAYPPTDLGVINVAMNWKRERDNGTDRIKLDLHPSL